MNRRSPLHDLHLEAGARLVPFGGWEMPLAYPAGTLAEHAACRTDAVVFDVSHLGTVRLEGPGAEAALQRTFTNDLARIAPGRAQYTHLLAEDGSVLDDLIVWWLADDIFDVMPNASNTDRVLAALPGATDTTATRAVLAVQGPAARPRLASVFPAAAEVGRFRVARPVWRGVPCTVAGTGYTGEDGVEIAVPAVAAADLWRALLGAGVVPAGLGARDTLRLEAGLPLHGHELGPGITPLQAGLGWVVAWDKPAFPGRAALEAERQRGPARVLTGLVVDGRQPPREGYTVTTTAAATGPAATGPAAAAPAATGPAPTGPAPTAPAATVAAADGVVTSGNFSPTLGRGIALAFLPPGTAPGTPVRITGRGRELAATVATLPFVHRTTPVGA